MQSCRAAPRAAGFQPAVRSGIGLGWPTIFVESNGMANFFQSPRLLLWLGCLNILRSRVFSSAGPSRFDFPAPHPGKHDEEHGTSREVQNRSERPYGQISLQHLEPYKHEKSYCGEYQQQERRFEHPRRRFVHLIRIRVHHYGTFSSGKGLILTWMRHCPAARMGRPYLLASRMLRGCWFHGQEGLGKAPLPRKGFPVTPDVVTPFAKSNGLFTTRHPGESP